MILNDASIKEFSLSSGMIEPYLEENLQPASMDLTLGDSFREFKNSSSAAVNLSDPETFRDITNLVVVGDDPEVCDAPQFVLHPGEFALAETNELVRLPINVVGRVEGKSSLGRLGLLIHATAGFIDPGFQGNVTLEMTNLLRVPIILKPGILICQMSFHYMNADAERPYQGRYQGAAGVEASKFGETIVAGGE